MTTPPAKLVINHLAEIWLSPAADIYLAVPNGNLTFFAMVTDKVCLPNAYPKFIWEKLGWTKLDDLEAKNDNPQVEVPGAITP